MQGRTGATPPPFHTELSLLYAAPPSLKISQSFPERIETEKTRATSTKGRSLEKYFTARQPLHQKAHEGCPLHNEEKPPIHESRARARATTQTLSVTLPAHTVGREFLRQTQSDAVCTRIDPDGLKENKRFEQVVSRNHEGCAVEAATVPQDRVRRLNLENVSVEQSECKSSCLRHGWRLSRVAVALSIGVATNLTCFSLGVLLLFNHFAVVITISIVVAILLAEFHAACVTVALSVDRVKAIQHHILSNSIHPVAPPCLSCIECAWFPFKVLCAFLSSKRWPSTKTKDNCYQQKPITQGVKPNGRLRRGESSDIEEIIRPPGEMRREPSFALTFLPAQRTRRTLKMHTIPCAEVKSEKWRKEQVFLSNKETDKRIDSGELNAREGFSGATRENAIRNSTSPHDGFYKECRWCRQTVDQESRHVFLLGICAGRFNRRPLIVHLTLRLIRVLFLFLCGTAVWMKTLFHPGLAAAVFSQAQWAASMRIVTILSRCCLVATLSINVSLSLYLLHALVKNIAPGALPRSTTRSTSGPEAGKVGDSAKHATFEDIKKPLSESNSCASVERGSIARLYETTCFPAATLESDSGSAPAAMLHSWPQHFRTAPEDALLSYPSPPLKTGPVPLLPMASHVGGSFSSRTTRRGRTTPNLAVLQARLPSAAGNSSPTRSDLSQAVSTQFSTPARNVVPGTIDMGNVYRDSLYTAAAVGV